MPKEKLWPRAEAEAIWKEVLPELKGYSRMEVCGSYRRKCDEVHDLDVVVVVSSIDEFVNSVTKVASEVLSSGPALIYMQTKSGMQIDFMFSRPEEIEPMMLHFTGSKMFNIFCRSDAKKRGWKLNQYGLYDVRNMLGSPVALTEEGILTALGRYWFIDPKRRSL